jgi:hypothetical protein
MAPDSSLRELARVLFAPRGYRRTEEQEALVTRSQAVALILLGVLFLIAVVILTIQVIHGGFDIDELPG